MRFILIFLLVITTAFLYLLFRYHSGGSAQIIIHVSSAPGINLTDKLKDFNYEDKVNKPAKTAGKEKKLSVKKAKQVVKPNDSIFKIIYSNENIDAGYHIHVSYDDFTDPSEIFQAKQNLISSMPNGMKDWEDYIEKLSHYNINKVCKPSKFPMLLKQKLEIL